MLYWYYSVLITIDQPNNCISMVTIIYKVKNDINVRTRLKKIIVVQKAKGR